MVLCLGGHRGPSAWAHLSLRLVQWPLLYPTKDKGSLEDHQGTGVPRCTTWLYRDAPCSYAGDAPQGSCLDLSSEGRTEDCPPEEGMELCISGTLDATPSVLFISFPQSEMSYSFVVLNNSFSSTWIPFSPSFLIWTHTPGDRLISSRFSLLPSHNGHYSSKHQITSMAQALASSRNHLEHLATRNNHCDHSMGGQLNVALGNLVLFQKHESRVSCLRKELRRGLSGSQEQINSD